MWIEAWARAPHNREVSEFLDELHAPWLETLAAIVASGVSEGVFAPSVTIDEFIVRFAAMLDGLALLRLRRAHQPSRKPLTELAMRAARAELAAHGA